MFSCKTKKPRSLPGGASWILGIGCLSFDQRARASGSPLGFLALIVRFVIEIIMSCTLPHCREPVKQRYVTCCRGRGYGRREHTYLIGRRLLNPDLEAAMDPRIALEVAG
jgi:hypothetical protein